ncbi:unnamed protein product, partial [Didymodactylos carnosus]
EKRRIDLTRHLLYACSKFIVAAIAHIHLYTLYKWYRDYGYGTVQLKLPAVEQRDDDDYAKENDV